MQDENNREPTDAQKADMVLRGHMLSLCSPLWWESEGKFVVHSGAMCVVKTPKAVFGIANNHVFEQYQKDKADKKDVFCQLGSGPFDPVENIISYNWYWDLATFRIPTLTLKHFNHKILPHDQWPPALLQTTDHVAYGGYPEDRRLVSQEDRPEKMTADLVSFRGTPNGCSGTNVSRQIDRAKLLLSAYSSREPHRARRNHLRRTLGHRDCVREADNADF